MALICVFLLASVWLGFAVASLLLFVFAGLAFSATRLDTKAYLIAVLSAVGFVLVIFVIFNIVLKVQTPNGFL